MRASHCACGTVLRGETLDALTAVYVAHVDEAHAELGLTEGNIRDYLEAEERLSDRTERLPEIGALEVREVGPELLDELLAFFDVDAFAGNPAWAGCYCMCHHVGGSTNPEWGRRRAAQNRAELCERIRSRTTTGYLATVDGRPAGWVNASERGTIPEHAGGDTHPDATVGAIVCFVIAPPYRRHGVAASLLDAALAGFHRRGLRVAEAYPRRETRNDASAYHGPLSLYRSRGFAEVRDEGKFVVVQKPLGDG